MTTTIHSRARIVLNGVLGRLLMAKLDDPVAVTDAMVAFAENETEQMREALNKVYRRSTPHIEDTDQDRVRDLYHIHSAAAAALGLEKKPFQKGTSQPVAEDTDDMEAAADAIIEQMARIISPIDWGAKDEGADMALIGLSVEPSLEKARTIFGMKVLK